MIWKRIYKTPTIIQMEAVECGAAALGMILAFHGRYVSLPELREACIVSRDGSNAMDIIAAAKRYGLDAYLYTSELQDIRLIKQPVIAFWGFNHFVVIEGFRANKVYLNDPASGERTVSYEEFKRKFTGIYLAFKPSLSFKKGGEKSALLPSILRRFKGHYITLSFLILTGIGLILPGLLLPLFSKMFVDNYLSAHLHTWLMPLLVGMLITFFIQSVLMSLQNYYLTRFQVFLALKMGSEFVFHVLKLPLLFFNLRSAGDITQRFTACDQLAELLSVYLLATLLSVFTVMFYLILMIFYSFSLALVGTTLTLLNIVVMVVFSRKQVNINRNLVVDQGHLFSLSVNGINAIETYKASAAESDLFSQWAGYFTKVLNGSQSAQRLSQALFAFNGFLVSINLIITLSLGGYFVMQGNMTLGMLVAFQSLLIGFMQPFNQLVRINTQLQQMQGNFNRIDDVLNYPVVKEQERLLTAQEIVGNLQLNDVSFGYSRGQPALFKDFNLIIEPGKSIGIIGPSRCGGSTLAKLIAGLYEPWSGEILLNGKPRSDYSRLSLAHFIGYVGQTTQLFDGTVSDNITLWNHHISDDEIILAAKSACIHDIIAKREGAYQSLILEGGRNFSGGECQRIAIARALVRKPSLLILDSATSALDPPVEAQIYQHIQAEKCAVLIIAHRLSSIRHCDEILVMDQGVVIESGTHERLVARGGWYAKIA